MGLKTHLKGRKIREVHLPNNDAATQYYRRYIGSQENEPLNPPQYRIFQLLAKVHPSKEHVLVDPSP
jgi:hypothetical protein